MPKLTADLLLAALRDAGSRPLGVREILAATGLNPGARTALKRTLRDLVQARLITGEGKRYTLRVDPSGAAAPAPRGPRSPGPAPREATEGSAASRPPHGRPQAREAEKPAPGVEALLSGFRAPGKAGRSPRLMVGVLHLKSQGYGFVSPVAVVGEDLFLPAEEARGLADGDLIRVEQVAGRGGRTAARFVELVERRCTHAVGRYERRGREAVVVPRSGEIPFLPVAATTLAKDGDAVRVRLAARPEEPSVVEAVLGDAADPSLESLSVAYGRGFSDVFSQATLAEAASFPDQVTTAQRAGRRDLTGLPLITIDGEDARDFDDAVHVESAIGGTRLLVAIADVASYVRAGSELDVEALRRATSVYFPDRVLPMLPERLSNGLCSLMPDVERLCLVADLFIDAQGQTRKTEVYPAVMRSIARCTYTQVAESLAGGKVDLPLRATERLPAMRALAETLARMRERRGAIDFNLTEQKIVLGADGKIADVVARERNEAHRLIESFMLAANEAVAAHFLRLERPSIFRVHDQPNPDKLEMFLELARAHGLQAPVGIPPRPTVLNAFLKQLETGPTPSSEARALNALLLRSMMQASYAAANIGHYGLGAEGYLHFTSPIRRYPDLMVHRLLWLEWQRKAPAEGEELSAVARRCSERERAAMGAERDIQAYYGALWASDHVGERFSGTIDGATENGVFVEIDGHLVSGMVSADQFGVAAELDRRAHRWILGHSGFTLGIGDVVEVEILSANVARRQIDLSLPALGAIKPGRNPEARRTGSGAGKRLLDRPPSKRGAGSSGGQSRRSGRGRKKAVGTKAADGAGGARAAGGPGGGKHSGGGKPQGGGKPGGGKSRGGKGSNRHRGRRR